MLPSHSEIFNVFILHAQKGTVLNGLCSIGILTYDFVIQQSLSILRPASCCPNSSAATYCLYYCTELEYGDYRFSLLVAAAVFSIALALLPLILLYYPCVPALIQRVTERSPQFVTCHKLAPVLDVFQSEYKPKLQFFAALPLLYRHTDEPQSGRNSCLWLYHLLSGMTGEAITGSQSIGRSYRPPACLNTVSVWQAGLG